MQTRKRKRDEQRCGGQTHLTPQNLLGIALQRKRAKLTVQTVYFHEEVRSHILNLLPTGWKVIAPPAPQPDITPVLSSVWPCDKVRKDVEKWLKEHGCKNPEDMVDGACEPLAVFLSCCTLDELSQRNQDETKSDLVCMGAHQRAIRTLEENTPSDAARIVFGELASNGWKKGPSLWACGNDYSLVDFLYGTDSLDDMIHYLTMSFLNFSFVLYLSSRLSLSTYI